MKVLLVAASLAVAGTALPAMASPKDDLPRERTAVMGTDKVQRQQVYVGNYYYRPDQITVKVGQPVELMFNIPDGVNKHTFVLFAPEAGLKINTAISQRNNMVTFTPTKTGSYTFYCNHQAGFLRPHSEQGETGTLIVVD